MSGFNESLSLQPRGQVVINGVIVNWISLEIDNNNFYLADSFRVEIAANDLESSKINDFVNASSLLVNISIGYPSKPTNNVTSTGMTSYILGQVDDLVYDPFSQIITISGRDLTARLIDHKSDEKFQNKTSSDIAITLAQRRGLIPVITKTSTNVGKYYQIDHSRITREVSEWDLLTWLARNEQFDVFVQGNYLYFQPPQNTQVSYDMPFNLAISGLTLPNANVISINLTHNKTLAKDVTVQVKTWNQIQAKAFSVTVTAAHQRGAKSFGSGASSGTSQAYQYTFPNLTKDQAVQKAQQLAFDITSHEMLLEAEMSGDNTLTKKSIINVTGTNTIFDQKYYVDSIVRKLTFDGGYTMSVRAKNHSPITQNTI